VREAHPAVGLVGVFVDAPLARMAEAVERCALAMVQLHGSEDAALCRSLPWPWFKAHRLRTDADLAAIFDIGSGAAGLFLADAWHPTLAGGTGLSLDASLAAQAARRGRMILAGGLTAETVDGAIAAIRPSGVDVASGVESAPGVKDHAAMRAFVERARAADRTFSV
jgi:phosphoribosylanthranilate isomerase